MRCSAVATFGCEICCQRKIVAEIIMGFVAFFELQHGAVGEVGDGSAPANPDTITETVHAALLGGSAEMDDDAVAGRDGRQRFGRCNRVGDGLFLAGNQVQEKNEKRQCDGRIPDFHDVNFFVGIVVKRLLFSADFRLVPSAFFYL